MAVLKTIEECHAELMEASPLLKKSLTEKNAAASQSAQADSVDTASVLKVKLVGFNINTTFVRQGFLSTRLSLQLSF